MTDLEPERPVGAGASSTDLTAEQPVEAGGRRTPLSRAVLALGVVAVLLAGAAVYLGLQVKGSADDRRDRRALNDVAVQQALNLTSLSSDDLDAGLERVRSLSTGDFRDELEKSVDTLRARLKAAPVKQESKVLESGVARLDGDEGAVLVALDSLVTSGTRAAVPLTLRLQIDLQRVSGTWLVSDVTYEPSSVPAGGATAPTAPVPSSVPSARPPAKSPAKPSAGTSIAPTARPSAVPSRSTGTATRAPSPAAP